MSAPSGDPKKALHLALVPLFIVGAKPAYSGTWWETHLFMPPEEGADLNLSCGTGNRPLD